MPPGACLLADGYAGAVDAQGRHRGRRSAVAGALPLRLEGRNGARPARSREPPPPRPPGGDVLRGRAAVAALRAGLRLPRGRPRVGLRPRAAGDDRRRLVEPRASPTTVTGDAAPAGTTCSPTWRRKRRRFGGLGPFTPQEVATLIGSAFIGSEAMLLLGFDRHQLPIRASLRRVGAADPRRRGARASGDAA